MTGDLFSENEGLGDDMLLANAALGDGRPAEYDEECLGEAVRFPENVVARMSTILYVFKSDVSAVLWGPFTFNGFRMFRYLCRLSRALDADTERSDESNFSLANPWSEGGKRNKLPLWGSSPAVEAEAPQPDPARAEDEEVVDDADDDENSFLLDSF
ncbi:hypothetical protein Mapa_007398 [Marchantia paleacea]|nr:hypothetical protein Mapa_007398 [Marchantia paleacea]